jgi:hypothetical protein
MYKIYLMIIVLLAAQFNTSNADPNEHNVKTPMMDGKCHEYQSLEEASATDIGAGVILYSFQDNDYVWFCYSKNKSSWGTLDLFIDTPKLEESLNLHVSAQLGEWPADKPELAPQEPNSDLWWEIDGWWANVVALNGMKEDNDGKKQINFKLAEGREIVLSKDRFGRGNWDFQFKINSILHEGERRTIYYPQQVGEARQVTRIEVF